MYSPIKLYIPSFLLLGLALMASLSVSAQFGPFGIGNATGADGQPKLLFWMDGSSAGVSPGDDVITWTDLSGNNNHFIAPSIAESPILSTGNLNGQPYLTFNKANNRLIFNGLQFQNNEISIFYVIRGNDTNYGVFSFSDGTEARKILIHETGSQHRFTINGNEITTGQGDIGASTTIWRYAGLAYSPTTSVDYFHRSDLTNPPELLSPANVFPGENINGIGNAAIGHIKTELADANFIPAEAFTGDIAEIFVFDGQVNKAMLRMINTYFRTKYEVGGTGAWDKFNTPATHIAAPIGIGRDTGSNSEHGYSRRDGLVLRETGGGLQGSFAYLSGAHNGGANIVTTADCAGAVVERWSRNWFVRKDGMANNSLVEIAFDLGEGIGGDFPFDASNYRLLRRNANSGNFSEVVVNGVNITDKEVRFELTGAQVPANGYYTLGTINNLLSPVNGQIARTWYAYQNGNWNNPATWTLDGSTSPAYINPAPAEFPALGDVVIIGSGRTVTCNVDNRLQRLVVVNGVLNIAQTSGHNFSELAGSGLVRCAGTALGAGNFPIGDSSPFADPLTGGTLEIYGAGFNQSQELLVNKLRVNMSNSADVTLIRHKLTHNGTFEIERGTVEVDIPISANRIIQSNGDVVLASNGRIRPASNGSPVRSYNWNFAKNLRNDGGQVRFTNRVQPAVSSYYQNPESNDYIVARFISDTEDQSLTADGLTVLSRIVVDKGVDFTYIVTVSSSSVANFHLLGPCTDDTNGAFVNEVGNSNSCAIINGTLEVGQNIFIPLQRGSGNYSLNESAMLWINGGSAAKGAPQVLGTGTTQAITPYGVIKVSAGDLFANCESGITIRDNGLLQVEGTGSVYAWQIRTSVLGPENIGGYIQTGGTVTVDGDFDGNGSSNANGSYCTFSLTYPGNLFRMSGGELTIQGPTGDGLVFINSSPEQTSITGGKIILNVKSTASTHRVSTRAPFWDLEITRTSTSGTNQPIFVTRNTSFGSQMVEDLPLVVQNLLTIESANGPRLRMRSDSGSDLDLHLQGGLTIKDGGVYDHLQNTTLLYGNASSLLNLPTLSTQIMYNVRIEKALSSQVVRIVTGNATALEISGIFELEKGTVDNNSRSIRLLGDISIKDVFGTPTSTGSAQLFGTSLQIINSVGGVFHRVNVDNAAGVLLATGDLVARREFQLTNGVFEIGTNKLRLEGGLDTSPLVVSSPSTAKCFKTNGSAGAGGLEIAFRTSTQNTTFPVGVDDGFGGVKYTPAFINVNTNFSTPGFIRIVPVDELLATVDLSAGGDYIDFYWKVRHSEFASLPSVTHRFQYDDGDIVDDLPPGAELTSGRVLAEAPFNRSSDILVNPLGHVDLPTSLIYYNGPLQEKVTTGDGTPLVNADYTAGNEFRFIGSPKVYFSREGSYGAAWDDPANWNELSMFLPSDGPHQWHRDLGPSASTFPQAGDIAFIGFTPSATAANVSPHVYTLPAGSAAARLGFTRLQDASGNKLPRYFNAAASSITVLWPTLLFNDLNQIENIKEIEGVGTLLMAGDVDLSTIDLTGFLNEDESIILLQGQSSFTQVNSLPVDIPNLFVTSDGNGSTARSLRIVPDINVRRDLELVGNADLLMNPGTTGNIVIGRDLILAKYQAGISLPDILFNNTSDIRSIAVNRDLILIAPGASISVSLPDAPQQIHTLSVAGNIIQNTPMATALRLFTSPTNDFIELRLVGPGNHSFVNTAGNAPALGRLIVDKGLSLTSSFTFNSNFTILSASNLAEKPLQLRNGLLTLNNSLIDITLSSGGGDFVIPSTSGIRLQAGALRTTGVNAGLLLDGLLQIDNGTVALGTGPTNNYVELGASGTAKLYINAGSMTVGSQLRRGLANIAGVLDYRQTGGVLRVGVYDAPAADRGVFEVTNAGSRFDFTGGTIEVVRRTAGTGIPSVLIQPGTSNTSGTAQLVIGASDSPSSIGTVNIQSTVPIDRIRVNNLSTFNPRAQLISGALTINKELSIDLGATFDFRTFNLTVLGDIDNDGTLTATTGKLILNTNTTQTISGLGSYSLADLDRIGTGTTQVSSDILVGEQFFLGSNAIMDWDTHSLILRKNATVDGTITFDLPSLGVQMAGSGAQVLRRSVLGTSNIDILTIDNPSGVNVTPSGSNYVFAIAKDLRMSRGVFNLSGNLLDLGVACNISQVNPFGNQNMISTGGAFTNFGVRKTFGINTTQDFFAPLGLDFFMPVRMILDDVANGYGSGSTESSYLFRLTNGINNVVIEDDESMSVPPDQIVDADNVLQMYYSIDATNVGTGLRMDIEFNYDQSDVAVTTPPFTESDYLGVRIQDNPIPTPPSILFPGIVDASNNIITFPFQNTNSSGISGDYFAGIVTAIPENVPVYTTLRDGDVDEGGVPYTVDGVYDLEVPGNSAPNGAVVVVATGHTLNVDISNINFFKTFVSSGATLNIVGTSGHRLGRVEGTGTIRLVDTGLLPSGSYNEFFVCDGGKLEFAGTTNYEILGNLPIVERVTLTGSGNRELANNDVSICNNFIVDGPTFRNNNGVEVFIENDLVLTSGIWDNRSGALSVQNDVLVEGGTFQSSTSIANDREVFGDIVISSGLFNVGNGGRILLHGDLIKSGSGAFSSPSNSASFIFRGSSLQTIQGDFTTANTHNFRVMEIDNLAGLMLDGNVDVQTTLRLTLGNIFTSDINTLSLNSASATAVSPTGGSAVSFVDGPLNWTLTNGASIGFDRIFPIGKGERHRPLLLARRASSTTPITWTAEYYDFSAADAPTNYTMVPVDPVAVETISVQEYWRVNSNTADDATARVGLSWGVNSAVSSTFFAALLVLEYDGVFPGWQNKGGTLHSSSDGGITGSFRSLVDVSFSEKFFTLGSSLDVNPLPVTWLYFNGENQGDKHVLSWATSSEENNSHFILERSADAQNWQEIAEVAGAGYSTAKIEYEFVDYSAPFGRSYYRLRQVDFDTKFEFAPNVVSLERAIEAESSAFDFILFPNPNHSGDARLITGELRSSNVRMVISDILGKVVADQMISIDDQGISQNFDCDFQAGVYVVSLYAAGKVGSKKLVVSR